MSLATSIKDFADLLTEVYTAKGLTGEFPTALLLQHTIVYIFKSFFSALLYLLSFQWFRDISYLPLLAPQIDQRSIFGDNLSNPASHIFSFSAVPKQATDQLFAGLFNSFFFSLPVSLPHIISLRRLFSQGPIAAAASVIGLIAANGLVLAGTVYGLRSLIIPYLSLEPFNYIAGIVLVSVLVKSFAEQRAFRLVSISDTRLLIRIAVFTFLLTLCEEPILFHSLSHLTLNAQNSCFELYPCANALESFIVHTTYLVAFLIGHCAFSALFYGFILQTSRSLSSLGFFTTAAVTLRMSRFTLYLTVAFTVASFPYYGLDYLITKVAGFLPEDPVYSQSVFSPTRVRTSYPHFFQEMPPAERNERAPLSLDLNYFDRGLYLNAPRIENEKYTNNQNGGRSKQEKKKKERQEKLAESQGKEKASQRPVRGPAQSKVAASKGTGWTPAPALTFEELNYQGEYAWISRKQLGTDIDEVQHSILMPLFKKTRQRYANMIKLYNLKKEERAQIARDKTSLGSTAESKDGVLPGDKASTFLKMSNFLDRPFLSPLESESRVRDLGRSSRAPERGVRKGSSYNDESAYSDEEESSQAGQTTSPFALTGRSLGRGKTRLGVQDDTFLKKDTSKTAPKGELVMHNNPIKRELNFERKIRSNYSKGFVPQFSLPYENARYGESPREFLPVKNALKRRYFLNSVYQTLLQVDIDSFLARQPASYKLAANQEFQLYQKRQILQRYYNWLRYYKPLEKMMNLHFRVPNTRSFVDRVYHQQFKGTLRIAKRLFKVTFDSHQNASQRRVLSYDQLLYNDLSARENPYLHEELLGAEKDTSNPNQNPSKADPCFTCQPFIEETNSSPTYAGWDPVLRRFVVTNRFVLKPAQQSRGAEKTNLATRPHS